MKSHKGFRLLICLIAILTGFSQIASGQYLWEKLPSGIDGNINDLCFVSTNTGFVSISRSDNTGAILKTTDGGKLWSEVPIQTSISINHITKLQFLDELNGFAFAICPDAHLILTTTDGGDSWRESELPVADNAADMHFLSPEQGYIAFNQPDIYKYTGDLNTSGWLGLTYMGSPVYAGGGSLFVKDQDTLFVLYYDGYMPMAFKVIDESDMLLLTELTASYSTGLFSDVEFINSSTGFIVGEDFDTESGTQTGIILKTTNGGNKFFQREVPKYFKSRNAALTNIHMCDLNTGVAAGYYESNSGWIDSSYVMITENGGETWEELSFYSPLHIESIAMPAGNIFYIAGDTASYGGLIYKFTSTDIELSIDLPDTLIKNCNDTIVLSPSIHYTGEDTLLYSWIPVEGLSDANSIHPKVFSEYNQDYTFFVSDGPLTRIARTHIEVAPLERPEICMVSYDFENEQNRIVFTHSTPAKTKYYNIYAGTSGMNALIEKLEPDGNFVFSDTSFRRVGNPYSYQISATDFCSLESKKSTEHQVISLRAENETDLSRILNWEAYKGRSPKGYNIYKDIGNGLIKIGETSSDTLSFTDGQISDGNYQYQVSAIFDSLDQCFEGRLCYSFSNVLKGSFYAPLPYNRAEWYETQSTINFQIKDKDSVCLNQNINVDTLIEISPQGNIDILWSVKSHNEFLPLDSNILHIVSDTVVYCTVSEINGCIFDDSLEILVKKDCETLITQSICPDIEVKLYPNPGPGNLILNIQYASLGTYEFKIFDVCGQSIYSDRFEIRGLTSKLIQLQQPDGYYIGVLYFRNQVISKLPVIILNM